MFQKLAQPPVSDVSLLIEALDKIRFGIYNKTEIGFYQGGSQHEEQFSRTVRRINSARKKS